MQLKRGQSLRRSLAIATSTLLTLPGTPSLALDLPEALQGKGEWDVDTQLLLYQENDDRVQDLSFKSIAVREFNDSDSLSISLQLDSLTGASPSGALRSEDLAQTFTRPSGSGAYTIDAGDLPMDDTFRDSRGSFAATLSKELSATSRYSTGASLSREYDYLHLGVNAGYSRDFNNRNTTLSGGMAVSRDAISAVGGTPEPLSSMRAAGSGIAKNGDESKLIVDGLLGVTQIINRRSLMQFNYSFSLADGYLNDPYKLLSVLDANGDPVASVDPGLFEYRYESRPDSRLGHNLYAEYKYRFDPGIFNLTYRFHTDDWGIDSHTVEARFRWLIDERNWLEPHTRFYSQSEADFYRAYLADGDTPEYASADYRLAAFEGVTIGLAYGHALGKGQELGASIETYQTTGDAATVPDGTGTRSVDYPDLDTTTVRLTYSFNW